MPAALTTRLGLLAGLVLFGIAAWVLQRELASVSATDLKAYFRQLPPLRLALAFGFAMLSYFCLTWYDTLAVRFVANDATLPWRRIAPVAFIAYALGHNVGASTLSGGAVRLREYTRHGLLTPRQVAGVITLVVFALGMAVNLLLDYALVFETDGAARVLGLTPTLAYVVAAINFGFLLGYLFLTARRRGRPFSMFGKASVPAPPLALSLKQLAVAVADLACSAAAFYCLLPVEGLGYAEFLGYYVLAMVAGIVSSVPGGLGVFETVLVLTVKQAEPAQLAGAALAFRALYYLLPLVMALLLLAVREVAWVRARRRWAGPTA